MKLIIKDRGMGKTTQLIHTSEITGYPIVASTEAIVNEIKKQAERIGCKIPEPMTVQELLHGKARGRHEYENILVDEVCINGLLQKALNQYFGRNVIACTCSPDYTWEEMMSGNLPKRNLTVSSN